MSSEPHPPDPAFPRISDLPFPSYRFVPGRTPHPRNDPRGHSFAAEATDFTDEARAVRNDWRESPHFCYSVDLYNYAYWWEAHEGWEGLWRCYQPGDPYRLILQAFIQVSAAHLQRFMLHANGARHLLKHARLHLDAARAVGPVAFGVNLDEWWFEAVEPYFNAPYAHPFPFLRPQ